MADQFLTAVAGAVMMCATAAVAQVQQESLGDKGSHSQPEPQHGRDQGGKNGAASTMKLHEDSKENRRVQLSQEQRGNVHAMLLKEADVNRTTNVNFPINVGTRVPRSLRLSPLPASVISVAPTLRSYQYVVVNGEICIVDPNSLAIVELISGPGRKGQHGGPATLVLTEEEKAIILQNVDLNGSSTLGLGALLEGALVPRHVRVRFFPATVIQQIPKVRRYKYFTADNRVALVTAHGFRIQLVIDGDR